MLLALVIHTASLGLCLRAHSSAVEKYRLASCYVSLITNINECIFIDMCSEHIHIFMFTAQLEEHGEQQSPAHHSAAS